MGSNSASAAGHSGSGRLRFAGMTDGPWTAIVSGERDPGEAKHHRRSLLRRGKTTRSLLHVEVGGQLAAFRNFAGTERGAQGSNPETLSYVACYVPAGSQIRWRSSASQPTRMARVKVSRSEYHVCDDVTGRSGPGSLRPTLARAGAGRGGSGETAASAMIGSPSDGRFESRRNVRERSCTQPKKGRRGTAVPLCGIASPVTTGHGDAASQPRKRRRCQGSEKGSNSLPTSGDARFSGVVET